MSAPTRYRLRTLMIVLALGPMVLAGVWFGWQKGVAAYQKRQERKALIAHFIAAQRQADARRAWLHSQFAKQGMRATAKEPQSEPEDSN